MIALPRIFHCGDSCWSISCFEKHGRGIGCACFSRVLKKTKTLAEPVGYSQAVNCLWREFRHGLYCRIVSQMSQADRQRERLVI